MSVHSRMEFEFSTVGFWARGAFPRVIGWGVRHDFQYHWKSFFANQKLQALLLIGTLDKNLVWDLPYGCTYIYIHILFYLVSYTLHINIVPTKFTIWQFSNVNWWLARVYFFFLFYFIKMVYVCMCMWTNFCKSTLLLGGFNRSRNIFSVDISLIGILTSLCKHSNRDFLLSW